MREWKVEKPFKFDQLAVVAMSELAQSNAMRIAEFTVRDTVTAVGYDDDGCRIRNVAELAFNYTLWPGGLEYEVLRYLDGWNWHGYKSRNTNLTTSHFGIHVQTAEEVSAWKAYYGTPLQEVVTIHHSNPACANRRYHYVILDAVANLGCELKIIRRLTLEEGALMEEEFTS